MVSSKLISKFGMIILLGPSLADELEGNPSFESDAAIAIDVAAEAYRRGHHILLSDIATLDRLILAKQSLHDRTRTILNRVRSKTPTKKALIDRVNLHIRLVAKGGHAERVAVSEAKTEVRLPAKIASTNPTLLDRTAFIAENIDDANFYQLLATSTINSDPDLSNAFGGVEFSTRIIPGGGHTTWQLYKMEMDKGESFCLAIVDSDQKSPDSSYGDTAEALCSLERPPNQLSWNCSKLILAVRTVENLFPISEMLMACHDIDKRQFDIANQLIAHHWGKSYWCFLPIKRGIKCHDLFKNNSNDSLFWRDVLHAKTCTNFTNSPCERREAYSTYAIEPLSSSLLRKFSNRRHSPLVLHPKFDAHIFVEAKRIIESMIALFCAERKSFDGESTIFAKIA